MVEVRWEYFKVERALTGNVTSPRKHVQPFLLSGRADSRARYVIGGKQHSWYVFGASRAFIRPECQFNGVLRYLCSCLINLMCDE